MSNTLLSILVILTYFVIFASGALIIKRFTKIPHEVFRKLLHMILLGSLICWIFCFDKWYTAAISSIAFAVVVYPILSWAEHFKGYSKLLTERKTGEIKRSLLTVFGMFSVVITVCWGIFSDRFLALASIFAWGFGDAAAALIGKRYGKHKLSGRHIEGTKSVEGSLAMFAVSFVSVISVMLFHEEISLLSCIVISAITAAVSSLTELFTKNGMDTITCPLTSMCTLLLLLKIFGGLN